MDPEELIDRSSQPDQAYGHKASMLQDVEAHRPTEIDYLNGEIVLLGRLHGVPTPINAGLQSVANRMAREGAAAGSMSEAELEREVLGSG